MSLVFLVILLMTLTILPQEWSCSFIFLWAYAGLCESFDGFSTSSDLCRMHFRVNRKTWWRKSGVSERSFKNDLIRPFKNDLIQSFQIFYRDFKNDFLRVRNIVSPTLICKLVTFLDILLMFLILVSPNISTCHFVGRMLPLRKE